MDVGSWNETIEANRHPVTVIAEVRSGNDSNFFSLLGANQITKNQNTFAKRQREMEKKRKAEEKRQRRNERKAAESNPAVTSSDVTDDPPVSQPNAESA